ncbi:MAG: MopE-related protein [Candidatus Binatia bacterium]
MFFAGASATTAVAASPCDNATHPNQCGWYDQSLLPPFVKDAILAKGGVLGAGNVLVLTSGDPGDTDSEISNDMGQAGCGTNPDGWETYDCTLLGSFVPPEDSVVLALSSEWYEWYQSIFTDWMTTAGTGIATVDVSINSWIDNKVDIIPYGPWETGVVLLTSLSASKMVDFRVADSGDHIYDTAIVVVPATWFGNVDGSNGDPTLLCGNGELEPGEDCDDGNNVSDDGCSTLCLGTQPPPVTPPPASTCGNLFFSWPTGLTSPYTCGSDTCKGFRCLAGNTISPACYTAAQCADACSGDCVDIQTANLDCTTMCAVQPPATEPPPVLPETCDQLVFSWPDGATLPYSCDDDCHGQRCVTGAAVSPECFTIDDCDSTTCPDGVCVDTPADDCQAFCAGLELPAECSTGEIGNTRPAAVQSGPCLGNVEICKDTLQWRLDDNAFNPEDEDCNGIDDDCNGIVDDMFETCGDPGLCQNTINTCDPANPGVPVVCETLPVPSPVEICNNGLDDDCEGEPDDGCECGDDECMPGENWSNCQADCPPPPNGTACDDGNFCTVGETWQAGNCTGGGAVECGSDSACVVPNTCNPATGCSATKLDCNDGIGCTTDVCDAVDGCANLPDDFACNDDDPCTVDTCDVLLGCTHTLDPACEGQDSDGDGYVGAGDGGDDCNDGDAAVHPGAAELCNGNDDDCDSTADDGFDVGAACESPANDCGSKVAGVTGCAADGLGTECGAVMPPNPAGYGEACESDANDCGQTNSGTIGCDVTCDATVPANPVGYGDACESAPNACGQTASGTKGCDASCNAVTPEATDGDSDGTPDCLDACAADPAKTAPGACGCGVADTDSNANGVADCNETLRADVGIVVERLTAKPTGSKRMRFRLVVSNFGPDKVTTGATATATISGVSVSELKLSKACAGTQGAISCTTGPIGAGRRKFLPLSFLAPAGSAVTIVASVSSPLLDPNPGNQQSSLLTLVP